MADSFELAYLYSRVCGSFSRAFLGKRGASLARITRMADLWRAVFGTAPPDLPQAELIGVAERKFITEALKSFRVLASCLSPDDSFVDALGRKTEYSRVKRVMADMRQGHSECFPSYDPKLVPGFNEVAYPDIVAMFKGGRYAWIADSIPADPAALENRLDIQYYNELWAAALRIPSSRKGAVLSLIKVEAELQNVVWAQRLKHYYRFDAAMTAEKLLTLPDIDITGAALEALAFRTDKREDWAAWKWSRLLDSPDGSPGGGAWSFDVRALEKAARREIYRTVRRSLHLYPSTYTPLYCFFKIKEFETALVLGLFEGMYLGSPADETAAYAYAVTGGLP